MKENVVIVKWLYLTHFRYKEQKEDALVGRYRLFEVGNGNPMEAIHDGFYRIDAKIAGVYNTLGWISWDKAAVIFN